MKLKSFITVDADDLSQNFSKDKVILVSYITAAGDRTQDSSQAGKFNSRPGPELAKFMKKHFPYHQKKDDGYHYKNEVITKYMCFYGPNMAL